MLIKTGVPTIEDVDSIFPCEDRMKEGAVAVVECYQEIPCDPCYTSCPRKAFREFKDINDRPSLDESKCNGCGICLSKCPGLAIMVVDKSNVEKGTIMKLPFEFLPLPEVGSVVDALDREGNFVCKATVDLVLNPKSFDKTPVIQIVVSEEYTRLVRNIRVVK